MSGRSNNNVVPFAVETMPPRELARLLNVTAAGAAYAWSDRAAVAHAEHLRALALAVEFEVADRLDRLNRMADSI